MASYSSHSCFIMALLTLLVTSSMAFPDHRPDSSAVFVSQQHHADSAQIHPPGVHTQPDHEPLHTLEPLTGESHPKSPSVVPVNQPQLHEPGNSIPKVINRPGTPEDYSYFNIKDVPEYPLSNGPSRFQEYIPVSPIITDILNLTGDATTERSATLDVHVDAHAQVSLPLTHTYDVAPGAIFFPQDPLQTYSSYSEVPASSVPIEKPSEEVKGEEPYKGFLSTWWNTGSFQDAAAGQINHSWKSLGAGAGAKVAKQLKGFTKGVGIKVAKKSKKILIKAAPIVKKIIGAKAIASLFQSAGISATGVVDAGSPGLPNPVELVVPSASYGAPHVYAKHVEPEHISAYGAPPQIPQPLQIPVVSEHSYEAPSVVARTPNAILNITDDFTNKHSASLNTANETPAEVIASLTPSDDLAPGAIFLSHDPLQTYSSYSKVPASLYPIEKPSEEYQAEEPYNGFLATWWNTGSFQDAVSGQTNHLWKSFTKSVGAKITQKWKGFTKGVGLKVAKKSKKILIKAAPIVKTVIGAKAVASLFHGAGINAAEVDDVGASGVPPLVEYQASSATYGAPLSESKPVKPEVFQVSYSAPHKAPQHTYRIPPQAPQHTYGAPPQALQAAYGAPPQSPQTA